jgi:hypothetical protein
MGAVELSKVINLSLIKLKTAVNMTQAFIIIASSIFVLLGLVHGVLTLKDISNPSTFTPLDAELREAMQKSAIAIHPNTNLWRAWLGFNLSHSLGIIFFGSAFLYIGIYQPSLFTNYLILQVCAIVVSAIYVVLSVKFWFINPAIGSGFALTCFSIAMLLSYF